MMTFGTILENIRRAALDMPMWRFDPDYGVPTMVLARSGEVVAKVTSMGQKFRGHVWTRQGYSTSTFESPREAQEWCELLTGG